MASACRRTAAVLAAALALTAGAGAAASADVLLQESFTGPASAVPLRVGGSFVPCLTASTDTAQPNVPGCPAGQPAIPPGGDPAGQGALRLTDNGHDRSGFALYHHAFPFTHGIRFTFTTFAYDGTRVPGYGAADGISVFLVDGAVGARQPGAFGGSLGYAQKAIDFDGLVPDIPGVAGGYLGVGIDEFGNYGNDREARGYGCAERADRDIHPDAVGLRGPGVAGSGWLRGYCLLGRAQAPIPLDQPDATSRTAPGVPHTFRVEVDPLGRPDGTVDRAARVRVFADFGGGGSFVPVLDAPIPPDPPETFEFGLAASTGDGTNVHEIRALSLETVAALPRFTLAKSHPRPLVAGARGSFVVQAGVAADGGVAYAPVQLDDELPEGLTIAAPPHGEGWECGATVVGASTARCSYHASLSEPLPPGTRLPPVTVPVDVAADASGRLVNLARLSGPEIPDPIEARDPFELERSLDVGLVKRANPTRLAVGERTAYTLVATNHGPSDAHGVVLVDHAPAGLVFDAALPSQGRCERTRATLRCELGTIRAGASAQVALDATATAAAAGRTLRNDAVVTAPRDRDRSNDRAHAVVEVVGSEPPPVGEPRLTVEKRARPARVQVGQPVRYTIDVRNTGTATARDVTLTDTASLPGRITAVTGALRCSRGSGLVARCQLGDVAPGETVTIRAVVVFDRPGRAGNTVSVGPPAGPLGGRVDTAGVVASGGAALTVRKQASRTRARVGQRVRYRIAVRSLGPEPARRVRVCDRLPRALRPLRPLGGGGRRAGRVVCWRLPSLAAGRTRTFALLTEAVRPTRRTRNVAVARAENTRPARAARPLTVTRRPARPPAYTGGAARARLR